MTIRVNGNTVSVDKKVAAAALPPTNATLDEYLCLNSDYDPVWHDDGDVTYIVRDPNSVITYLTLMNFVVEKEG